MKCTNESCTLTSGTSVWKYWSIFMLTVNQTNIYWNVQNDLATISNGPYMRHCTSQADTCFLPLYELCNISNFLYYFSSVAWTSNLRVTWKRCALCKHPCIKLSRSKIHPLAGQEVIAASTTLTFPAGFNCSCVSIGFLIGRFV